MPPVRGAAHPTAGGDVDALDRRCAWSDASGCGVAGRGVPGVHIDRAVRRDWPARVAE